MKRILLALAAAAVLSSPAFAAKIGVSMEVFQDAAGQGKGAVDAALALAAGKPVEKKVYIPFQLVTPANMDQFMRKN